MNLFRVSSPSHKRVTDTQKSKPESSTFCYKKFLSIYLSAIKKYSPLESRCTTGLQFSKLFKNLVIGKSIDINL